MWRPFCKNCLDAVKAPRDVRSKSIILGHCVNFKAMRYKSTSFIRIVADKSHLLKPGLHIAICLTDYFVFALGPCVNFKAMRYESTSFSRIVADKSHLPKPGLHIAICLTDYFVFALGHCMNFKAMRYESTSFNRIVADWQIASSKTRVTQCDLSGRLFCIRARSLCELQSDEILVNKFQ